MSLENRFDVIVVGGGHAGTEACAAAARMGQRTLLLTHNIETIGQMSCNPAIGGIGKSHLVREVDALGGVMALATDRGGIQFRVLNSRKGPAVRATRAQADRVLYKAAVREALENQDNLYIFQQAVDDLIVASGQVEGVVTQTGLKFYAPSVVLAAGTFLGGVIHVGLDNHSGGRAGDPPSIALSKRLRELPIRVSRLKTGTPPRIDARTVNFEGLHEQWGDQPTPMMSFMGRPELHPEQICCWVTHTNEKTHELIHAGLERSPMYSGVIEGVGPRYCPSIEDKVVRFSDKSSHQIFIEPEGLKTHELYPNGISTSLPYDVQLELVHSIKGFENAHITRPGYAIEYDYFDPRDLNPWLENKSIAGLYFAGQINGTTGYEEAASQGLLAGVNAALRSQGEDYWYPGREQAYIGVMVDDLITMGATEPYRMFTSRAEYRLLLREDNADIRLTSRGRELGLVDDSRWKVFEEKQESIASENTLLNSTWVQPGSEKAKLVEKHTEKPLQHEYSLYDLLKRPELNYNHINQLLERELTPNQQAGEQVEIVAKYAGYIDRQSDDIARLQRSEAVELPKSLVYSKIQGLSNEIVQKLEDIRPQTIGQASRISGVTPAAISLLLVYLKKHGVLRKTA